MIYFSPNAEWPISSSRLGLAGAGLTLSWDQRREAGSPRLADREGSHALGSMPFVSRVPGCLSGLFICLPGSLLC